MRINGFERTAGEVEVEESTMKTLIRIADGDCLRAVVYSFDCKLAGGWKIEDREAVTAREVESRIATAGRGGVEAEGETDLSADGTG